MKDAIYRQDAIDAVTKYCLQYDLRELLAEIETLPPAEPKQGKWMHCDKESDESGEYPLGWMPWYCSECGVGVGKHRTRFCPDCGAKMNGGQDD